MSQLHVLLEELRVKAGVSPTELSRTIGRSPSYFRKLLETEGTPGTETLTRLARVLSVDPSELINAANNDEGSALPSPNAGATRVPIPSLSEMPRDVPVYGTASGSVAGAEKGAWQMTHDAVDWARRPPSLIGVPAAYGLYVENESMWPRYPAGELVIVHPGRVARPGDIIIVQVQVSEHAEPETYIKELVGRSNGNLVCLQYNPKAEIRFKENTVKDTHLVLTTADLLGS